MYKESIMIMKRKKLLLTMSFLSLVGMAMLLMSCSKEDSSDYMVKPFIGSWEAIYSTDKVASENPIIVNQVVPETILFFFQDGSYEIFIDGELNANGYFTVGDNFIKLFRQDGNYASFRPIFSEENQKLSLEWLNDSERVYFKAPETITYQRLK